MVPAGISGNAHVAVDAARAAAPRVAAGVKSLVWVIVGAGAVVIIALIAAGVCVARKACKTDNVELEKIISGDKWGLVHSLIIVYGILVIVLLAVVSQSLPGFQLPVVLGAVLGIMGAGFAHALGRPKK
jgi:hypothetical protein